MQVGQEHHRLHWQAFDRLRAYIDEVSPDAILLIGDDQAQCFQANNLPPYAIYVGQEVDAKPFYMSRFPGDEEYIRQTWQVGPDHQYMWPSCTTCRTNSMLQHVDSDTPPERKSFVDTLAGDS